MLPHKFADKLIVTNIMLKKSPTFFFFPFSLSGTFLFWLLLSEHNINSILFNRFIVERGAVLSLLVMQLA